MDCSFALSLTEKCSRRDVRAQFSLVTGITECEREILYWKLTSMWDANAHLFTLGANVNGQLYIRRVLEFDYLKGSIYSLFEKVYRKYLASNFVTRIWSVIGKLHQTCDGGGKYCDLNEIRIGVTNTMKTGGFSTRYCLGGLGQLEGQKKTCFANFFLTLVYLFFIQCFFNQIILVSSYDNLFIAKY